MDSQRHDNLIRAHEIIHEPRYRAYRPLPSIKFNKSILAIHPSRPSCGETEIEIENTDSISAALNAVSRGYRPLVLNMANSHRPGGGFLNGAQAQEEDLFRHTNLHQTLVKDLYPMGSDEVIYSPSVHILRDANYVDLIQPVEVGFISVAAIDTPDTDYWGRLSPADYRATKSRIDMAYRVGLVQRYDCLILGALGCGAFNNPPKEIAKMFCEITEGYLEQFKYIIFPIKCGPDNQNCDVFQSTFVEAFASHTI